MTRRERRRRARAGTCGRRGARVVVWCTICGWDCDAWMHEPFTPEEEAAIAIAEREKGLPFQ